MTTSLETWLWDIPVKEAELAKLQQSEALQFNKNNE